MPAKRTGSGVARSRTVEIDGLLCRRSPHLVSYWRGTDFVVENYATTVRARALPITSDILAFFDDWRRVDALLALRPSDTHDALRSLIAQLLEHSLLQRSDQELPERERAMALWEKWNPAAGFFHVATKDVNFVDMNTQVRSLRDVHKLT